MRGEKKSKKKPKIRKKKQKPINICGLNSGGKTYFGQKKIKK